MKLKSKKDGKIFVIKSGQILSQRRAKEEDFTASFLTIAEENNPEQEHLYIWPYFGEQEYEIVLDNSDPIDVNYTVVSSAPAEEIPQELITSALAEAEALGKQAGEKFKGE